MKKKQSERNTCIEIKHVNREADIMIGKRDKYVIIHSEIKYNSQIHRTRSILLPFYFYFWFHKALMLL